LDTAYPASLSHQTHAGSNYSPSCGGQTGTVSGALAGAHCQWESAVFRLRFRRLIACQPPGTAAPRLGRRYGRPVRGYGSSDATAGSRPPIAAITPPRGGRCQWPELSSRLRELRFKFIAESWPPAKSRKIWPESKSDPKSYKAAAGLPENMTGRHSIRIPSKGGTFPKVRLRSAFGVLALPLAANGEMHPRATALRD
jgi:hypothetical protein